MADIVAVSNAAADAAGIPRLLMLACGIAESNLNPRARRPRSPADDERYWPDVSGGVWQQTVRWDPEYRGGAAYPGSEEVERVLALQYVPERSASVAAANLRGKWQQYQPDILATLYAYNWPAGNGKPADAAAAANYRRGVTDAEKLLGAADMPVTFNPATPPIAQDDAWSCAPTALRWALTALGRNPGPTYIEDLLVRDGVVSKELGLLDASGAGLAAWIGKTGPEYYGGDGFYGNSEPSVTFDGAALEGDHQYPILIGGRQWNHWCAVRGYDATRNVLLLSNPADGWMGVGQEMTPQQFGALGAFSMVRVLHPDLPGVGPAPVVVPPPPPPAPDYARLLAEVRTDLRAVLAKLDAAGV